MVRQECVPYTSLCYVYPSYMGWYVGRWGDIFSYTGATLALGCLETKNFWVKVHSSDVVQRRRLCRYIHGVTSR